MLDGGMASGPKHAQEWCVLLLGKIPTVHVALADVTVVGPWSDYQLVAWEGEIVRSTIRWPRFARSRISAMCHQADVFFSAFVAISTAGGFHIAVDRCFLSTCMTCSIIVAHNKIV